MAGNRKKRSLFIAAAVLLALALAFFLYTGRFYRAGETALKALESDAVRVERTDYGWLFDGPAEDAALVFYPGAKVEETAYAPLLHRLAENGLDVCLVKMPFRLAFFGQNAAEDILARGGWTYRLIGGHSLGGAVAANYAAAHDLDGVILLAAYPTREVDEPMLLSYGEKDGVLNRERAAAAPQYGAVEELVIDGGNHANFGDYGAQKGDGAADISAGEQQEQTARAVAAWLARLEENRPA